MLEFDLAMKRLSVRQLKRIAVHAQVHIAELEDKKDFVNALSNLSDAKQLKILQELVAVRASMSMFKFADETMKLNTEVEFKGEATPIPQIVTVGKRGQIVDGLRHIVWAMLDGQNTFVDKKLEVKVAPEALIVNSFYDDTSKILQVRAGASPARKIKDRWAEMHSINPDTEILHLGITTLQQFHDFVDQVGGKVEKCRGMKGVINGFGEISGKRHPLVEDLRVTDDYEEFNSTTDPTIYDMSVEFSSKPAKIGFGFESRSVVFHTMVEEEMIQHIYEQLKIFLKQ